MTYARRVLALLLIFCVLLNLAPAAFAESSDELLPPEAVPEETASEETVPADG